MPRKAPAPQAPLDLPCHHCGQIHRPGDAIRARTEREHLKTFVSHALVENEELATELFYLLRRRTSHPMKALVVLADLVNSTYAQADNDAEADAAADFFDRVHDLLLERQPRGLERLALDKKPAQA